MAFGQFAAFAEDLTESVNGTMSFFVQKLRLTTPSVDAGDYRIGWSYTWGNESTGDDTIVQIEEDDTTVLYTMQAEPQDSGTDQRRVGGGFAETTLSAGVHTFDMDFTTSDTGSDARIQQARMEFWKVS